MKKISGVCGAVLAALFLCRGAEAIAGGEITVDTNLANSGAVSSTYSMRTDGLNWASAGVVVTSVTSPNVTFTGGSAATATLTVASYTGLSTATASGTFTAVSTTVASGVQGSGVVVISSNVSGTQIAITGPPGALNFMVGGNVAQGYSSTSTAVNFATAVNASSTTSNVTATVNSSSTTVTITCVNVGTLCNGYAVTSSSPTAISTAAFSGGANPVVVTVGFAQLMAGRDFAVGASPTAMATNLAAAIAASSNTANAITAASAGTVVSATATVAGVAGNSLATLTSNALAISTAALTMSGGQNNATVTVNGVTFTANQAGALGFYPVTSTNQTATNLAAAIAANYALVGATATAAGSVVSATATVNGTAANSYAITVSTNAITPATLVSSSAVTGAQVGTFAGGTAPGYVFNGSVITAPGNNLQTGEGVLFPLSNTGTLTPLVTGTTYFVIAGNPALQLATTSTGAVAGVPVVFTSSSTAAPATTYTLTVPAIAGTPSYKWLVSDDNINWVPYPTTPLGQTIAGPISIGSYFSTGTVNAFDFGHVDWGWLGFALTAPTAGAISANVKIIGKQN